jgi:steroid 5-alpha reductase family enzyme
MFQLTLVSGAAILVTMTLLFIWAVILKNNSIVDIGWGMGFVLVAWILFLFRPEINPAKIMMTVWVTLWGFRLSLHIFMRSRGKGEDFRYAGWRREWKRYFALRSYFQIFMLQGLLMLVISLPIIILFSGKPRPFSPCDGLGSAVFMVGFCFETLADLQLRRFMLNPENRGKLMTTGLWAWSRHPNYFGEAVLWWGFFLLALPSPGGWFAAFSPITITLLVRFVSGVPLLEKKYAGRPDFEAYKKRTPIFFPSWPKRSRSHE